jgi:hypothetical protein
LYISTFGSEWVYGDFKSWINRCLAEIVSCVMETIEPMADGEFEQELIDDWT